MDIVLYPIVKIELSITVGTISLCLIITTICIINIFTIIITNLQINLVTFIGEDKGYVAANNKILIGREGVVCNV